MSVESIRKGVEQGQITFGPHLVQRMWENAVSIDQVLDVIATGTVQKKEKDERSQGKFNKFTIVKGKLVVVVKDCDPAFIITANRER